MTENHFADSPTDPKDRWHEPEELTCYTCDQRAECKYVDDWYNTGGECLAMK